MNKIKKSAHVLLALLLVTSASSYFFAGRALATNGILGNRQIKMSSSQTSATNVKYTFSFAIGTTGNVGGFVADFCQDDPIPGDSCTAPTGFNSCYNGVTGGCAVTLAISNQAGTCSATNWSIDTTGTHSTSSRVELTRTASSLTAGCTVSFDLTGFTNGSVTNNTFYARIFTYSATGGGSAYTSGSPGTYVDAGGVALSTTAQLTITAKVQEQLTLCIYTGANCGAGGTAVTLGNNGVLDVSHAYTNVSAKFQASTNASSGMTIYAQGTTLTSPASYTIAAINSGAGTAVASSVGNEQFGFCVAASGGSVVSAAPYNDASCSSVTTGQDQTGGAKFAFDTQDTPNMTTSGGMPIASSTGPSSTTTGTIAYLANIAPTTKAGIYSTTQTFIGVGTF